MLGVSCAVLCPSKKLGATLQRHPVLSTDSYSSLARRRKLLGRLQAMHGMFGVVEELLSLLCTEAAEHLELQGRGVTIWWAVDTCGDRMTSGPVAAVVAPQHVVANSCNSP